MRYMAIDLGGKRTGLAVGDDQTRFVSPVDTIEAAQGPLLLAGIRKAVEEHGPGALVVGLPINMDGTEGPSARRVRGFAAEIARATALPVHFQDERLTSFAADQAMARSGRTHGQKKALRDALAAAELLRDFLATQGGSGDDDLKDTEPPID